MDSIFNSSAFALLTFISLYENKFQGYVAKYPPTEKELEEEKKYVQILQYVLNEVNRYSKFLGDEESFFITFRISAYLLQISTMDFPNSSKIHSLLLKINNKINNRS